MDKQGLIWANLLHLGFNMWEDRAYDYSKYRGYRPTLTFDEGLWNDLLERMQARGLNMVVLDVGDGVRYESHPEIAVEGAWSVGRLGDEVRRLRAMGLEPIPKLNFATTHDAWLGDYARMVSSPTYYKVVAELIAEVGELFDHPRFFHLGMDEETAGHQSQSAYVVVRQFELWWHDLYFYADEVKKAGIRPWIWSDHVWHHPWSFFDRMPKDILQSNWYYGGDFRRETIPVRAYLELEAHGYDQVPTSSNHYGSAQPRSFEQTVDFCGKQIAPERLFGFLQTPWRATKEEYRDHHLQAIDQVASAKKILEEGG